MPATSRSSRRSPNAAGMPRDARPSFKLRRGPSEHEIQCAVFQWAAIACRVYPDLRWLYAVPNAGRRSIGAARYMVAEGLRRGVPDVCLPVSRGTFGALYIEHKSDAGALRADQREWVEGLRAAGNCVIVSRSFDESRRAIVEYLDGTQTKRPGPEVSRFTP